MATSLAACLRSVAFEIPHVNDGVPLLDVDGDVKGCSLAGYRFWQFVLSTRGPHSGCYFLHK